MSIVFTLIIFSVIGTLRAFQPDLDFNRLQFLSALGYNNQPVHYHNHRSIFNNLRKNDYDYSSGRFNKLRPTIHVIRDSSSLAKEKAKKVYQPREDPRLFYQSDAYIEETNRKNLNNEVSSVYLGREVERAKDHSGRPLPIQHNKSKEKNEELCVVCPRSKTLIAKAGYDRALFQYPNIYTCAGRKAPKAVRINRIYGPTFGTLLKEGTHTVVGNITYKDHVLQTCLLQIHVVLQSCPVPKYLIHHCEPENKICRFKCRDSKSELLGESRLSCGSNLKWSGSLPYCYARTSCSPPHPPEHGKLSCKGDLSSNGNDFIDGSSCHIKCAKGWRSTTRAVAVCRGGIWIPELSCEPKRRL